MYGYREHLRNSLFKDNKNVSDEFLDEVNKCLNKAREKIIRDCLKKKYNLDKIACPE